MDNIKWLTDPTNNLKYYIDLESHDRIYEDGSRSGKLSISGHGDFGDGPIRYLSIVFNNTKEYEEFFEQVDDYMSFGPKYEKWMKEHGQTP